MVFRYEGLLGDRWVPYTAEALGVGEHDVDAEFTGMIDLPDIWQEPVKFAQDELDRVLGAITADDPGLGGLAGLRILLWSRVPAEGEPDVVIRASPEQLAVGRLRRAAGGVHAATEALRQARARLRAQVLAAANDDHLGRNQIAREVDEALARRLVLQLLAGHDLIRDIRAALPPDWFRYDGQDVRGGHPEGWQDRLGPFWCGPVMLELSSQGVVSLRIVDLRDGPDHDAGEAEAQAYEQAAHQRAQEAATTVHSTLDRNGLAAVIVDPQAPTSRRSATVDEVARTTVTIVRA